MRDWLPASEIRSAPTSAGVGDLLRAALDRGAQRVLVALGGTVTVDGGLGLLGALGALPDDQAGRSLLTDPTPGETGSIRGSQRSSSSRCTTSTCRSRGPMARRACSARRRGFVPRTFP